MFEGFAAELLAALVAIGLANLAVQAKMVKDISTLKTKMAPLWEAYQSGTVARRADGGEDRCPEIDREGER